MFYKLVFDSFQGALLQPLVFVDFDVDSFVFCYVQRERVLFFSLSSAAEWVGQHNQPHFVHFNYKFRK